MAASLWQYSTTPASNNSAAPDGAPEGMAPSGVNDAMRELAARAVGALKAVAATGGATNTLVATLAPAPTALVDNMLVAIQIDAANTGATTLNVNTLGAKKLFKQGSAGPTALTGYELQANQFVLAYYDSALDSANGAFVIVSAAPGVGGKVAQVVSTVDGAGTTGTTTIPFDNTIPQNTEGDQYLSRAITPQNASSTLVIEVEMILSNDVAANHTLIAALFQDSTANALAAVAQSCVQSGIATLRLRHVMTAGTTSATTFKVRGGCGSAGTTRFNGSGGASVFGGVAASSITIMEILP